MDEGWSTVPKTKGSREGLDGLRLSDTRRKTGVPDTITDAELAARLLPRRYATEYFVYGKDKCWRGDDMVDHTVKVATPIFNAAFPGYQTMFYSTIHPTIPLLLLMHFGSKT